MKRALREVQVQVSWDYWEAALHARRMDTGSDLRYFGAVESWGGVEGGGLFFWQQARRADQGGRKQARQTRPWDAEKGGQLQAAECRQSADREQTESSSSSSSGCGRGWCNGGGGGEAKRGEDVSGVVVWEWVVGWRDVVCV